MGGKNWLASVTAVEPELGNDGPLARRYNECMLKWTGLADRTFKPWPERPNCGHFFGGSYWYGIDTAFTVAVLATLASQGPYDELIAGVPRETILEHAVAGIRYLGFTHDAGPAEFVRVEGPNPRCSLRKWGGEGDPFFQASQCGRPVSALGMAAWLVWDKLDDETRHLVVNVVTSYADRWSAESPGTGAYLNTQTEENAWTGQGIYFAYRLFPDHPHAADWLAAAQLWFMNVRTVPDDSRDTSMIDDRLVKSWVRTVTTHPDFTVENHGVVHPFYQGLGIAFPAKVALWNAMAGRRELPNWLTHHMPEVYAAMKHFCGSDGQPLAVQGQDWWYEQHPEAAVVHCAMNVCFADREAAYLERLSLDQLQAVQDSNTDGHIYHSLADQLNINATQTIGIKEVYAAYYLASCYLMHRFCGEGVAPTSESDFLQSHSGVHEFAHGGVVLHRWEHSLSTFSWRNAPMALTLPRQGMWLITPQLCSYVGTILPSGSDADQNPKVLTSSARKQEQGFTALARMARCQGRIGQDVVFGSLPEGITVYLERTSAQSAVTIEGIRGGLIGVRNELYSHLPQLAPGRRVLYSSSGCDTFAMGFQDMDDTSRMVHTPAWLNLDDSIGYVLHGSECALYRNRHRYQTWKGFEDTLILNYSDETRALQGGEIISDLCIVTLPNRSHGDTERFVGHVQHLECAPELAAARVGACLVLGHFGSSSTTAEIRVAVPDPTRIPLYRGHQVADTSGTIVSVDLGPLEATYLTEVADLDLSKTPGTSVIADVVGQRLYLTNAKQSGVDVTVRHPGKASRLRLPPGATEMVRIGLQAAASD